MVQQPYPETADIETSNDDYAARFSGAVGQWMLDIQEGATLTMLRSSTDHRVLDVGGGHGQLAIPLCRDGYAVTVLSSAESCRQRIQSIITAGQCDFRVGDVTALPFADRSFPTVLSFRLLTHCGRWPLLVRELCRVAERSVIVDYPTRQSLNAIAPLLFEAKKKYEGNTRVWRLFTHRELLDAFAANGFTPGQRKAQFFLPMVLHRALKSTTVSGALEGAFRVTGLTALWGSPVIAEFVRKVEPGCPHPG